MWSGHPALPVKAEWTVRIERMEIALAVGIYADELAPQKVWVSLAATGRADAAPQHIGQCIDYEPLCRWLAEEWPNSPHTPLLETRLNELLAQVFTLDSRVTQVWAGLYKERMSRQSLAVGIERQMTRAEFAESAVAAPQAALPAAVTA